MKKGFTLIELLAVIAIMAIILLIAVPVYNGVQTSVKESIYHSKIEEVLAKAKRENFLGDEREKDIRTKRDAFSLWGFIILGCTIMIIKLIRVQSPADIISLFTCTSGLAFVYEGIKLKKKFSLICGSILLVFSAYCFYKFCVGLF